MNVDNTVPKSKYGYSDFLRDYLHCDEHELKQDLKKPEHVSETLSNLSRIVLEIKCTFKLHT